MQKIGYGIQSSIYKIKFELSINIRMGKNDTAHKS